MLRILKDKWAKNEALLREKLSKIDFDDYGSEYRNYKGLVALTFETIYNDGDNADLQCSYDNLNCTGITEIDDGDYQGTLLFLIPFNSYQPSEYEYLMTYIGYGSCTVCDTLQRILCDDGEERTSGLLNLCRYFVVNAIKPYNDGWRYYNAFEQVKFEEKENA